MYYTDENVRIIIGCKVNVNDSVQPREMQCDAVADIVTLLGIARVTISYQAYHVIHMLSSDGRLNHKTLVPRW